MVQLGITKCGKTEFLWGKRTYVMGIINMSPESFSGDGIADIDFAVEQAQTAVTRTRRMTYPPLVNGLNIECSVDRSLFNYPSR